MKPRFAVALLALILAFAAGGNFQRCLKAQPPEAGKYSAADHKVAEYRNQMVSMATASGWRSTSSGPRAKAGFPSS